MACAFVLADVALLVNNAHNTTNNKMDALKAYLETLLKNDWLLQKNMMFVRYNEGIRFGKYLEFESYSKRNVYESASGRTPVLMADCMYKPDLGGPAVGIRFTYEYHQKFSRDANYNLTKDIDTFYAEISAVQSGDTWGVTWEKAQEDRKSVV